MGAELAGPPSDRYTFGAVFPGGVGRPSAHLAGVGSVVRPAVSCLATSRGPRRLSGLLSGSIDTESGTPRLAAPHALAKAAATSPAAVAGAWLFKDRALSLAARVCR